MKKFLLLSTILVVFLSASFIEPSIRYQTIKSNLNPKGENIINSLDLAEERSSIKDAVVQFNLTFKSGEYDYYFKSHETKSALQLGVVKHIGTHSFNFGLERDVFRSAWENPYLINQKRVETDYNTIALNLGYKREFEKYDFLKLDYQYKKEEVDRELLKGDLNRKKDIHSLKVLYNYFFISFAGIGKDFLSEGKANNATAIGFEVELKYPIDKLLFLARYTDLTKKFKNINPIFGKKERDDFSQYIFYIRYDEPLNFKNYYLTGSYKVDKTNSNINFYDEESNLWLLSFGYRF